MFAGAPPRGGHGGATNHTPKFAAPPPNAPTRQDCPMLVIILINMGTKERKTPYIYSFNPV